MKNGKGMNGSHSFPAHTGDGMDHGKSKPEAGVSQRDKNHGYGYPLTIDSIDHANPNGFGITDRGKSNAHGHSYPGHNMGSKGVIKNQSPKPMKKHVSSYKHSQ